MKKLEILETISESISRASGIHCRAKETFALYFSGGRVASVMQTSPHFISKVSESGKNVVGIYLRNVDFRMVMEDIEFFYDEINKTKSEIYANLAKNRDRQNAKEQSETV